MDLFDLHGLNAVVTGATRGLGRDMALALAQYGADIVIVQRDVSDTGTKEKIEAMGRR